jgi:hypothetical protein
MEHVNISGIKCDNPLCDYIDASVKFEEYADWVNKSCPKCGENLLTQEDYDFCLNSDNMVENLLELLPEGFDKQLDAMLAAEGISQDDLKEIGSRISFDEIKEAFGMLGMLNADKAKTTVLPIDIFDKEPIEVPKKKRKRRK